MRWWGGGGSSNQPGTVDLGDVAYWTFDNIAAGKAENIKFSGWPVVLSSVSTVPGKYGTAVSFDPAAGSCAYLARDFDLDISFPENKFSFAAWINPREIAANTDYQILGDQSDGVKSFTVRLTNGKIRLFAGQPTSVDVITSTQSITTNTWTHVAISYDGNTARVFINGVSDSARSLVVRIPEVANTLYLGCYRFGSSEKVFPGAIDELYVSASVLTLAQINDLILGVRP